MSQIEKARAFAALHVRGNPVLLYNAWDAGSAKAILEAGAKAIATSSWSVAKAQGHQDGEDAPLPLVEETVRRITAAVDAPVTVDFEGGYSEDDAVLSRNVERLLDLGIVGINFEDRVVQGQGLYPAERQAQRIAAIRRAAQARGVDLFINARTDLFLGRGPASLEEGAEEAIRRAAAYAAAGASGFFIPGLVDAALIAKIVQGVSLPVNVMVMEGVPGNAELAKLGVARVSYGALPYIVAMNRLKDEAAKVFVTTASR